MIIAGKYKQSCVKNDYWWAAGGGRALYPCVVKSFMTTFKCNLMQP